MAGYMVNRLVEAVVYGTGAKRGEQRLSGLGLPSVLVEAARLDGAVSGISLARKQLSLARLYESTVSSIT